MGVRSRPLDGARSERPRLGYYCFSPGAGRSMWAKPRRWRLRAIPWPSDRPGAALRTATAALFHLELPSQPVAEVPDWGPDGVLRARKEGRGGPCQARLGPPHFRERPPPGNPAPVAAPAQGGRSGAVGNELTHAGGCTCPHTDDPPQPSNRPSAGTVTGDSAFGSLVVLLVCEVPRGALVGEQDGNVAAGEVGRLETIHDEVALGTGRCDAEYGFLGHDVMEFRCGSGGWKNGQAEAMSHVS